MSPLDKIDEIIEKIATPNARLVLLEILKKEGVPKKVVQACHKALAVFPDDIEIRRLLAETYFEQGLVGLAESELDKITRKINELSFIYKYKSELYRKENRIEEAIASLNLYLAHHGDDQEAIQVLSELGEYPKKEVPVLPTATLAELYFEQGELEESIKIYEQVIASSPNDEKSQTRLEALKKMREHQRQTTTREEIARERTLRVIRILETWLSNIEQKRALRSAHEA